jgi:hypothetical protein
MINQQFQKFPTMKRYACVWAKQMDRSSQAIHDGSNTDAK